MKKSKAKFVKKKKTNKYKVVAIWLTTLGLLASCALYLLSPIISNYYYQAHLNIADRFDFKVKDILIEGNNYAPLKTIESKLKVSGGDPILYHSLGSIRKSLIEIDWVEDAIVERHLPNTLYIAIIERTPIALWQNKGKVVIIDSNGKPITDENLGLFKHLPLVVGQDANLMFLKLYTAFQEHAPKLYKEINAISRIGDRRWNVTFNDGTLAKLPEKDISQALEYLNKLHNKNKLLSSDIKSIDLRDSEKYYVEKKL